MRTKPIKIDWDGLEEAFNEQRDDLVYYLDLVTGQVVLEGEGESEDLDPHDYSAEPPEIPPDDSTRLYVHPPDTVLKIEWLHEFLAGGGVDPGVSTELERATVGEDAAEQLRDIMNRNADVRDAWFGYRAKRIQALIEQWLDDHGVQFVDPPPW
jgi:hypothetical protein